MNIFMQQHPYFRKLLHFPVMILGIKNSNAFWKLLHCGIRTLTTNPQNIQQAFKVSH